MTNECISPLVIVVDDDASLRKAIVFLLESVGWRVAAYDSAEAFLAALAGLNQPGCLILDVRMPLMSGLELQRTLNERNIQLPVIFLTGHADVTIAVQAMKFGASDFIEKPFKDQTLLDAVSHAVRRDLMRHKENETRSMLSERLNKLTLREMEVARLVVEGLPYKAIGMRLYISERTVQVHCQNLKSKLGINSSAELTQMLLQLNQNKEA
ncbi:MAG: response regulator [Gammaproteobacteria bacterium]|nr:response regulator [Gammaproteobacteria bacterium]MBU1775846.1 response regulator [Gammaproteobacteria bacterium]MBU1969928.1 response regulator [Gammaproteobacteria bacterium]